MKMIPDAHWKLPESHSWKWLRQFLLQPPCFPRFPGLRAERRYRLKRLVFMEPVQMELRRVFPDFPFRSAPTPGSSGDAPQPDIRLAFTARFLKKSAERNGGGLQLAVQYAIAYNHAHGKHDQHRQGGTPPLVSRSGRCSVGNAAALNLKRLVTKTALPVASPSSHGGAAAGTVPAAVGKVTPVRYDVRYDGGQQDTSWQEENGAHFCAYS